MSAHPDKGVPAVFRVSGFKVPRQPFKHIHLLAIDAVMFNIDLLHVNCKIKHDIHQRAGGKIKHVGVARKATRKMHRRAFQSSSACFLFPSTTLPSLGMRSIPKDPFLSALCQRYRHAHILTHSSQRCFYSLPLRMPSSKTKQCGVFPWSGGLSLTL